MSTMAGQDRSVQVDLNANVTGYQRAMADAAKGTNALLDGVTKLARATDDLVKRAGRFQLKIAAGDIAALTAAAVAYDKLDHSMSQIRATSTLTGQNVGALRQQILGLSRVIPDSTNNIARLMGQVQTLGIQGTQNIRNFTMTAERLAAATDTPPGQLLTGIVQMNREMGNGLATVNNYSSALVELSKTNGVAAGDIMGFAQSIQSVAQQAGYTQTQVMGLATAFTRAGADSAAAANVFVSLTSQINQGIVSNSAQLNQFASLVGMTRDQFRSLAQSHPEQAFTRVIEAIQGQGQRGIITLQQLGLDGPRALRVIAALTSGQANMAQSMNQASDAYRRNNAMTKASDAAWSDFSSTMTKLRNEFNQFAVQLGGPMAHVLNTFFEGVIKVLNVVNGFLSLLGPIPGIVAGIGGAFLAVTGTITAFSIALLAAAGAWRALSGMTGTNILQGMVSGVRSPQGQGPFADPRTIFRQRPIDMERRSGSAQRIFSAAYGMGQRWTAPPPEDPTLAQRAMGAIGTGLRRAAFFPVRKLGWEAREALDTARHPFNYEARNAEAVNPMSMLGMFQGAQRGIRSAGQLPNQARQAGLNLYQRLPQFIQSRVKLDTGEAQAKIDALKASAEQRVSMRIDAGKIPSGPDLRSFVMFGPNGPSSPLAGAAGAVEEAGPGMIARSAGMVGRGFGLVTGALGTMASAVSSVVMPLGLLAAVGMPLYQEFKHLSQSGREAANNLDDLGAGIATAAGGTYNKPSGTGAPGPTPADKPTPFGQNERNIALSGSFAASSGSTIKRFADFRHSSASGRRAIAQQSVNEIVRNSNNGQPLSDSQRQALRESLVAAYNGNWRLAQQVYSGLNLNGETGAAAARTTGIVAGQASNDADVLQAPFQGSRSARQMRSAAEPIANALMSGDFRSAGLNLVGAAQGTGVTSAANEAIARKGRDEARHGTTLIYSTPGQQRFQAVAQSVLDQYNKGKSHDQQVRDVNINQVRDLQDFVHALNNSGDAGKRLASGLADAGLNANDAAASLKALSDSTGDLNAKQASALRQSAVGGLAARYGINLSNPNDINFATQQALITQMTMAPGQTTGGAGAGFTAAAVTNQGAIQKSIAAWEAYKQALNNPNDPAFKVAQQNIDSLNQSLMAQQSIFMTPQQIAGGLAAHAQRMITQFGTQGDAGASEQNYIQQAQAQITSSENQLKQYMLQVHQYHIDQQHEEDDHNRQLGRMWRDYNIQQAEALYQRNRQLAEANYQFNEQIRQMNFQTAQALGNPAQMVQSQFTEGAQQAMIGMNRQVQMLQDSKRTMDRLHQMGLSRDAIRLLGLDDPKNVEQAQRYLADFAQNPRLIQAFNRSIKGRLKISDGIDTDMNNSKFADMRRQFNHSAQLATEAFNHSQQMTNDAFHRSLADFQTDYDISVERQRQSLQQLGEQVYTSFQQLNNAAMHSGLANIKKFAAGIITAIGQVQNVESRFVNNSIGQLNSIGTSGGGGATTTSGTSAQGSQRGGGYGNAPVYGKTGGGANMNPNVSGGTAGYVAPGTGSVYTGGLRSGTSGRGNADYRPTDAFMNAHPADPGFNQSIAKRMAPHWATGKQWQAWLNLWNNESGWNQYADNPSSDAYGIAQALPATKYATAGRDWQTNPATQIKWGIGYIQGRYGDPVNAWQHELNVGWYAKGGVFGSPTKIGVGESGPEAVIPLNAMGSTFVARVVEQSLRASGIDRALVSMSHTMPRASMVINAPVSHHEDHSTNFTGPVTVEASDPNEMARKLEQRKRLDALRRPVARR